MGKKWAGLFEPDSQGIFLIKNFEKKYLTLRKVLRQKASREKVPGWEEPRVIVVIHNPHTREDC